MKRFLKVLLSIALVACFVLGAVACNKDNSTSDSGSSSTGGSSTKPKPTGDPITITVYTAVNIVEQNALNAVATAYSDLKYQEGKDITVVINNKTDPNAYMQNVKTMAGSTVSAPTIVSTSIIPEYYGTDKIVDLTEYLEEDNPYMEGSGVWKDGLEEDAYRTKVSGSSATIPGLSYSSNYLAVFYNKKAMLDVMGGDPIVAKDGTIDNSKITWEWLLKALKTAKETGKNFANPLGLSTEQASCGEDSFNMISHLINMYLDQYYRDFIEDVHSVEGDYSYIESLDSAWTYSSTDATVDSVEKYTYNLNKVIDLYFNQTGYNPESERYAEVMENLYDLLQYSDPTAPYSEVFSRFNETTLVYENNNTTYKDMKLFYVEALDYVRTYRDAFKTQAEGGKTVYPDTAKITSQLGWFLMPAMQSELEGVADNVRSFGGPAENFGVLKSTKASDNKAAIDFLKYLFSPTGQQAIYSSYKSANNAPITMRQLVKNVEIPAVIDCTEFITTDGDCSNSPYVIFAKGSGMELATVGTTNEKVNETVAKTLSDYFRGSTKNWAATGKSVFNTIKSGFASYANNKSLIFTDFSKVAEATANLKNSPFNTSD